MDAHRLHKRHTGLWLASFGTNLAGCAAQLDVAADRRRDEDELDGPVAEHLIRQVEST
jgi:hypothetical protein